MSLTNFSLGLCCVAGLAFVTISINLCQKIERTNCYMRIIQDKIKRLVKQ
jgi:hypothetical protein